MTARNTGERKLVFWYILRSFVYENVFVQVMGLYKGMLSPLAGISAQNSILFGVQRTVLKNMDNTLLSQFKAGCVTGVAQALLGTVIDATKIQLQMQNVGVSKSSRKKFKGPLSVLQHLFKTEGFRGTFRGFWITLTRDTPSYGGYFFFYAYLCELLTPSGKSVHELSTIRLLLAGGIAGSLSWTMIYPLDVLKSRVQKEGFKPNGRYISYKEAIVECYKDGGYRSFTRGLGVTVARAFPANAVTFATVTLIERLFADTTWLQISFSDT